MQVRVNITINCESSCDHTMLQNVFELLVQHMMYDLISDKVLDRAGSSGDVQVKITPVLADPDIEEDWNG